MSRRALFVSYGGGHIGMVLPVIRELEALMPGVQCTLLALTTGYLKAKAIRTNALGYKDFLHLVDGDAARQWGHRLSDGNTSPDVPLEETIAYMGINYLDLIAQFGEAGAAERYRDQGRYGFQPINFMRKVLTALGLDSDTYVVHESKPDWTCVISEGVRQRLIARGFPARGVVVTGNPAFDGLYDPSNHAQAQRFLAERGWTGLRPILFAGHWEPVAHPATTVPVGQALPREIEAVLRQYIQRRLDLALIVRYHPSDWNQYPRLPDEPRIHFSEPPKEPIHPLILASAVVVVQTSTVGLESAVGGRPVISVENSPAAYVWFSLAQLGVSSPAPTPSDLPAVVDAVLSGSITHAGPSYCGDGGAATRVAGVVRNALDSVGRLPSLPLPVVHN